MRVGHDTRARPSGAGPDEHHHPGRRHRRRHSGHADGRPRRADPRGVRGRRLADNNTRAGGLLDVLRGRGVADKDLRTSGLSISPTFEADGRISGYEVTNEVTATLRDIAGAGALVDAAAQAAGDAVRVQQIAFGIDDDAQPRAQARADAVRQAVTQARQLADAADVGLGPILSITEVSGNQPPVPITRDSAAAQAAVPIQPGTQDVSVTVEVVHAVAA